MPVCWLGADCNAAETPCVDSHVTETNLTHSPPPRLKIPIMNSVLQLWQYFTAIHDNIRNSWQTFSALKFVYDMEPPAWPGYQLPVYRFFQ